MVDGERAMKNIIKKLSEIVHEKDFDYDKLFRALAVAWLEKGTLQNAYNQINDVHPMGYLSRTLQLTPGFSSTRRQRALLGAVRA